MKIKEEGATAIGTDLHQSENAVHDFSRAANLEAPGSSTRIALLTPYTGNNLGDAAIVDAVISNLRLRIPGAQFSGITLSCENFVERHGVRSFPLCGIDRMFHGMSRVHSAVQRQELGSSAGKPGPSMGQTIRGALGRVPIVGPILKAIQAKAGDCWREFRHFVEGYRFLRKHNLIVVSGGGQLDEEWGGPWGHPFALFKWALLARTARIPFAIASVGACRVSSRTSRFFLSSALRLARYRSYRDKKSMEIAAGLLARAGGDSVVPDMALSLPLSEFPESSEIRMLARGRTVVGISPIAYARPATWPNPDPHLYQRYLHEMSRVVSKLIESDFFVVVVRSAISDENAINELLGCLSDEARRKHDQIYRPTVITWKDLLATLLDIDFVIASRLHSTILSFVAQRPVIAISFDPKVDWVMHDVGQTEYLLQIKDFTAEDVVAALRRMRSKRESVTRQIGSYVNSLSESFASQFDALATLASMSVRR